MEEKKIKADFPLNYESADDCMCSFTRLSCLCLDSGAGMAGECGNGCRYLSYFNDATCVYELVVDPPHPPSI